MAISNLLRPFLWASAVLVSALLPIQSVQAQSDPIRIGFITVRSGALAAGGKQMEEGIQLFLKERNNTIAGRKVELIIADSGGNPAGAKTKTQELVERNKVHVVIGPLAAFEALAIDDYIRQAKMPIISPSAAAEDLTQRKTNPWFVRTSASSAQPNQPLGEYAAKTLNYKRVVVIADDFAYGHETASGFQRVFEDNGGKVVQKLWPPLNVADYGSYIGQIKGNVDAIYAGFAGANGLRFLKQLREYGNKLPVLGSATTTDEGILKTMGDEAIGVISGSFYAAGLETPESKRFVAAVNRDYGADPGYYTLGAYSAGVLFEQAAIGSL
ncbi:MAG: ABC transporter substrate-binding protein, partial [Hylemonella sp.]